MNHDRMFRVIVLGGLALVGPTACANAIGPSDGAADVPPDFPSELPVFIDAGAHTDSIDVVPDFPSELPARIDVPGDDTVSSHDAPPDRGAAEVGVEAGAPDFGFPIECA